MGFDLYLDKNSILRGFHQIVRWLFAPVSGLSLARPGMRLKKSPVIIGFHPLLLQLICVSLY
jgi:hypothetical protein